MVVVGGGSTTTSRFGRIACASDLAELSVSGQCDSDLAELPVCREVCHVPVIWQNCLCQ